MQKIIFFYLALIFSLFSISIFAENQTPAIKIIPSYTMTQYNHEIMLLYKQMRLKPSKAKRIDEISAYFLDKPYLNGALGEGLKGRFDQQPLYRTDAFDCETFVDTVLALTVATNLAQFQKNINDIRYKKGLVNYFHRNHFTSVDWNKNNEENGLLINITREFQGYKTLKTVIDKPAWYIKHNADNLQLLNQPDNQQTQILIDEFHAYAKQTQAQISHLAYVPLTTLFFSNGNPNLVQFNKIPSGAVIEIVRANYFLDISHMGFAIKTSKGLMFREASSIDHKVIDVPLTDYLAKYYLLGNKTNVIGIHILVLNNKNL